MFSGIVETNATILAAKTVGPLLQIQVERPKTFDDLRIGDSVCTDGVCLTVEAFDEDRIQFALGPETLQVTGWSSASVLGKSVNLERSLRLNDRIHGHLVTGHVDVTGTIADLKRDGETQLMTIEFPAALLPFIWFKGSITINGVSLTVNRVESRQFSVGLIPETLRRTNLGLLKIGDKVNLEADNMARGLVHWARVKEEESR